MSSKAGRNDVCPCGSMKKYKKCCGLNENANRIMTKKVFTHLQADQTGKAAKLFGAFSSQTSTVAASE